MAAVQMVLQLCKWCCSVAALLPDNTQAEYEPAGNVADLLVHHDGQEDNKQSVAGQKESHNCSRAESCNKQDHSICTLAKQA